MTTIACDVEVETKAIMKSSKDMIAGMRKLKRTLRACEECDSGETCHIVANFNQQIQTALSEIASEWGLS